MHGGGLVLEAHFEPDRAEDFAAFVQSRKRSVFTAVADQLEEDFRQDTMPYLRGPARTRLLERKAGQTYRDTPFHSSASLGRDSQGRRDERVQLMALTNAESLNRWLTPLTVAGSRVCGLYSPPLIAPRLLALIRGRTGARPPQVLLVTVNRSGLRQTLIDGDVARFSRLAAVGDLDDPEFAADCLNEVNKTQQYLVGLRLLQRNVRLPALILVPPGQMPAWNRPGLLVDAVEPVLIDLDEARRAAGHKQVLAIDPAQAAPQFADSLWMHAAAGHRPRVNFAPAWLREAYRLWQARVALLIAGAAIMILGAAVGLERWSQALDLNADASALSAQTRQSEANYARIKRGFPPLPALPEQLSASVTAFEKLAGRTATPTPLLAAIGQLLEGAPEFRIDRLDWQLGATDPSGATADAVAPTANREGTDGPVEFVGLHGTIVVAGRAPDTRLDLESVEKIADRLRSIRAVRVTVTKLPIDLSPRASLSGNADPGPSPAPESSNVSIRVSRKVGS